MLLDEGLRERVMDNLRTLPVQRAPHGPQRAAAVAVALVEEGTGAEVEGIAQPAGWSGDAALLLTRRALTLSSHAGQWALPGGLIDEDETPEAAAARAGRGSRPAHRPRRGAGHAGRLRQPFRLRDHPGGGLGRRRPQAGAQPR
ncbi:NUDIX domain-containing protein [Ramlibacter montanisoli]|uniref:NUDIX domain-containing protein n=1 Tax=Ramlibacter montanisoli TaxID=2732512 RepID=UPI00209BC869|nr:NUDIX domain-containing protein [Ramlibacter montanisoli]